MFSKRPEICNLVRKLLKICQGWVDPHAVGAYGQYGDELKIKKNVLTQMYPEMCEALNQVFGEEPVEDQNKTLSCSEMRQILNEAENSSHIMKLLHIYAKENLLWLNVYVKDSFATRIIRDERMTRTSFVANVGGLLGLCMGFSLVSVAEIFYFCLKRNLVNSGTGSSKRSNSNSAKTGTTSEEYEPNATGHDVESISLETAPAGTNCYVHGTVENQESADANS